MRNQSLFVKIVIWFMVFLMSAGFVALVIAPFAGTSLFGGGGGSGATQTLVEEARADIKKDRCADTTPKIVGKRLERCQDSLQQLAAAYTTLAAPEPGETTAPRDSQRNISRAGEAYKALYELDVTNEENTVLYASYLRDSGKSKQALPLWKTLVKAYPDNEDYLLQLGVAYEQTQAYDEAIAIYRLFIKKFPDSGQIETIKEQIKAVQEQKKQAASGTPGAGSVGGAPITVG